MIRKLSEEIACECERISGESIEVYYIHVALNNIILVITFIMIGKIVDAMLDVEITLLMVIGMYIGFKPLRQVFGGIHFKSSFVCYCVTVVAALTTGYLSAIIQMTMLNHILFASIGYLFALYTFVSVGVIDNDVNPLLDEEKYFYKRSGLKVFAIMVMLQVVAMLIGQSASNALLLGVLLVSLNLHVAKISK